MATVMKRQRRRWWRRRLADLDDKADETYVTRPPSYCACICSCDTKKNMSTNAPMTTKTTLINCQVELPHILLYALHRYPRSTSWPAGLRASSLPDGRACAMPSGLGNQTGDALLWAIFIHSGVVGALCFVPPASMHDDADDDDDAVDDDDDDDDHDDDEDDHVAYHDWYERRR